MNRIIQFNTINNVNKGCLSFFESSKDIPFEIKRIYFTYGVKKGVARGMHAHKTLKQVLWCPFGNIEVILDNGSDRKSYLLDSPEKGLLLLDGSWREIYWKSDNAVLCVAASDYYGEDDYIRDYADFKKYVEKGE